MLIDFILRLNYIQFRQYKYSALEAAVTRDSGSELPPDGTVHALASNVCVFV